LLTLELFLSLSLLEELRVQVVQLFELEDLGWDFDWDFA
jgi:hypothetical protein